MTDGQPRHSRRALMRTAGITAAAGAFAAYGHGSVSARGRAPAAGNFPETPEWNFVFVNHVTTNPFWVPTIYGIEDAAALLGLPEAQWTGSDSSDVGEMVNTFEAAIAGGANGIAVALVDLEAFNEPVQAALDAGIPVVSYNADAPNARMSYTGQDLYGSGFAMGQRIVEIVGEGKVGLFIATPGQLNIQPRIDGALDAIAESGAAIEAQDIATGPDLSEELANIEAWYLGNTDAVGMFAVDAGSTQGVAQVVQSQSARDAGSPRCRRLRPAPDYGRVARRGCDRLHHRPAAVPAGLPAGDLPLPAQPVRRRGPPTGDEHRSGLPRPSGGAAVPRHVEPVRGRLRRAAGRRSGRCPSGTGNHRRLSHNTKPRE